MAKLDLRNKFPGVRAQRSLHSCTALVLCDALWWELQRKNDLEGKPPPPVLSPLFVYYNARKLLKQENLNIRLRISEAQQSLQEYGVCPEHDWPYDLALFTRQPPAHAYQAALPNRDIHFENLPHDLNIFKESLAQSRPFFFCIRLFFSNCWEFHYGETSDTGMIKLPEPNEDAVENHALLAAGYDDASATFLIRNSFGEAWGDGGYFHLPYDYIMDSRYAYAFWRIAKE